MKRLIGSEGGAATVELALVLPLLIMLLVGIFQFGFALNNYLAVVHAAREGARRAAVGMFDEAAVRQTAYPAQVDSVTLTYPSGELHGEPARVTVRSNVRIRIPFWGDQVVPLISSAEMRLET